MSTSKKLTSQLEKNSKLGLVSIVGGSNVSFAFGNGAKKDSTVQHFTVRWQDYLRESQQSGARTSAAHFLGFSMQKLERFCKTNRIHVGNISKLGLSVAGPVSKGDKVSLTNTPVRVKGYRLSTPFLSNFHKLQKKAGVTKLASKSVETYNDGTAGLLGEILHEDGGLFEARGGTFLILGTGLGGATGRIRSKKKQATKKDWVFSDTLKEFGHTVVRLKNGKYVFRSMEQLAKEGLFKNGGFYGVPSDGTYFEHRLAGPWFVAHFVRSLQTDKETLSALAKAISRFTKTKEFKRKSFKKRSLGSMKSTLQAIQALDEKQIADWARHIPNDVGLLLANFILNNSSPKGTSLQARLEKKAKKYKTERAKELGLALKTLRKHDSNVGTIVIGSGLGEALLSDAKTLGLVRKAAGLGQNSQLIRRSNLTAAEREAAFVFANL